MTPRKSPRTTSKTFKVTSFTPFSSSKFPRTSRPFRVSKSTLKASRPSRRRTRSPSVESLETNAVPNTDGEDIHPKLAQLQRLLNGWMEAKGGNLNGHRVTNHPPHRRSQRKVRHSSDDESMEEEHEGAAQRVSFMHHEEHSYSYKFDSLCNYNYAFMNARRHKGQEDPITWRTEDPRCSMLLRLKVSPHKAPKPSASKSATPDYGICRNFNEGRYTREHCKYSHTCLIYQQNHPASACERS